MPDQHKRNIMVVDDQPVNLKLMEDILGRQGYAVHSFPRGQLALLAAAKKPPDLILLDVKMPGMDGFEVCRRLRSDERLSSIPVIFLSAEGETRDKISAFNSGGVDYVTKPFEPEEVNARIEMQLNLRDLQLALRRHGDELEQLVKLQVRELAEAQMATIFALARLADCRDADTGSHLQRVQALCRLLAIELKNNPEYSDRITDEYVEDIFHASPLHDIGKVAIPDSILLKPGPLTPEEFAVMKTHTTKGAQTLKSVLKQYPANTFVRMGIEIAQSHHEKWDGTGYPEGRRGDAIPLSARIMAVADSYDAIRSRRCYKEARSHATSRDIILRGSGAHFDPDVVRSFCAVQELCENVTSD